MQTTLFQITPELALILRGTPNRLEAIKKVQETTKGGSIRLDLASNLAIVDAVHAMEREDLKKQWQRGEPWVRIWVK